MLACRVQGFASFSMLVIIELFGSPFLRNCSVIVALLFGES